MKENRSAACSCFLPPPSSLLPLVLLALAGCSYPARPVPILIGHVAPFSGPEQVIGKHGQQAIRLAVKQFNKEPDNGLAGRPILVLHPIFPPDDLDVLQPLAVRLIRVDNVVALLGGTGAAQVERLGQAAEPYKVPLLTPSDLPAEPLPDTVFSLSCAPAFRGEVLARFTTEKLRAGRLAILAGGRGAAAAAVAAAFREFAAKQKACVEELTYQGKDDFPGLVERLKPFKPQALLFAGAAADLGTLRARLPSAGLSLPLLFGGDGTSLSTLAADREASDGVYFATVYLAGAETPDNRAFVQRYQESFQTTPDIHAGLAYDGLQILVQAMRRARSSQPDKLRTELGQPSPFRSLTGELTFGPDHYARRPLFVVRPQGGRLQKQQRYDPFRK